MEKLCNIQRDDGFGAQLQTIMWTYIYCKMNNIEFYYSPIEKISHNYNNNPNFINKIENLINMKDNIQLASQDLKDKMTDDIKIRVYKYIERNINTDEYLYHLNEFKNIFFLNKKVNKDNSIKNVAVHVRRPNKQDNRIEGSNTSDNYYLDLIKNIKNKYIGEKLKIHIYSQGDVNNFNIYKDSNVELHINEDIIDTFMGMVNADMLITSGSSFSYTAAFLSNGEIYYKNFWHPPRKEWITCFDRFKLNENTSPSLFQSSLYK